MHDLQLTHVEYKISTFYDFKLIELFNINHNLFVLLEEKIN